jgi:hypothetical protein
MDDTEKSAVRLTVLRHRFGHAPTVAAQERIEGDGATAVATGRSQVIAAIRALADLYEANPGLPIPTDIVATSHVPADVLTVVASELNGRPYGERRQLDYDTTRYPCWITMRFVENETARTDRPL